MSFLMIVILLSGSEIVSLEASEDACWRSAVNAQVKYKDREIRSVECVRVPS